MEHTEPETEVHPSVTSENENESKSSPREMIGFDSGFKQGNWDEVETKHMDHNQLERSIQESSSIISNDSSSSKKWENKMFSGIPFDESVEMEDDFSFGLDLESDSEIQVAVNEIRKEAEKMDTILVLDQFKTLQTEFDSMKEKYSLKTMENEDLKLRLQESENRVAYLELERDLNHADAEKLREDLKTIVSKMFDISMYESSELVDENMASIKERVDSYQSEKRIECFQSPSETHSTEIIVRNRNLQQVKANTTSLRRENIRILGLVDQPRHVIRRLPLLSDHGLVKREPHGKGSHSSEKDTTYLSPRSRQGIRPPRNQNVFRKRINHVGVRMDSRRAEHQNMAEPCSDDIREDGERTTLRRHKSLSLVNTHSTSLVTETFDDDKETEKRRCGMIFRRRSKHRSFSKEDVSILKEQIHQLNDRMKTSLAASEKLRKRLKTISRYYERVISKLQAKLDEAREERSRAQDDLVNLASQNALERRLDHSKFEYELRRKDGEIESLKAGMDQGEV